MLELAQPPAIIRPAAPMIMKRAEWTPLLLGIFPGMGPIIVPGSAGSGQGPWTQAIGVAVNNDDSGRSSGTILCKYQVGAIGAAGNYVRATLQGPQSGQSPFNNVSIGLVATSGDAYDCASVSALLLGGSASLTLAANQQVVMDDLAFTIDGSRAIIMGYNVGSSARLSVRTSMGSSFVSYFGSGKQQANTANRDSSGYSPLSARSFVLAKLEVAP